VSKRYGRRDLTRTHELSRSVFFFLVPIFRTQTCGARMKNTPRTSVVRNNENETKRMFQTRSLYKNHRVVLEYGFYRGEGGPIAFRDCNIRRNVREYRNDDEFRTEYRTETRSFCHESESNVDGCSSVNVSPFYACARCTNTCKRIIRVSLRQREKERISPDNYIAASIAWSETICRACGLRRCRSECGRRANAGNRLARPKKSLVH